MEKSRTPERRPDEVETEPVRLSASPVRCPFCHADIAKEVDDWVACSSCLARHHAACWSEGGHCASCEGTKPLRATDVPSATKSAWPRWLVHAFLGYLTLGIFPVVAAELGLREHLRSHESDVGKEAASRQDVGYMALRLGAPAFLFGSLYAAFFAGKELGYVTAASTPAIMAFVQLLCVLPILAHLHLFRGSVRRHEHEAGLEESRSPSLEAERPGASLVRDDDLSGRREYDWRARRALDWTLSALALVPVFGIFAAFVAWARASGPLTLHEEHERAARSRRPPRADAKEA